MIDRRLMASFDWRLFGLAVLIVLIGIANIYSASASYGGDSTPYYLKQLYWLAMGSLLVVLVCSVDYHMLEDAAYWLYGIVLFLLVLVPLVGRTIMGATRWLDFGLFSVQPSEPMKLIMVAVIARYLARHPFAGVLSLTQLAKPFLLIAVPALLVMKQPDLGTAVLIILISTTIILYVGVRLSVFIWGAVVAGPASYMGWHYYLRDYQKNRILNFLTPERDPLGSGYHIIQSKIAVGSGGGMGKGFLKGTQSQLRFLPEQHTDFAFSVFAEEWGFVGVALVLLMYLVLVLWGVKIASRCTDRFGTLLAVGITAILFWHVVINVGMVIGLFPVVGVPLLLFSYGGTSMITAMICVGILLNLQMRRFMF
jgi:rod shape determining protein RodA